VGNTTTIDACKLVHGAKCFGGFLSGEGLTELSLVVSLLTVPSSIANMQVWNAVSIVAQEVVSVAKGGWDWGRGCWAI